MARLAMDVHFEWETGANDEETQNTYGTVDPGECAKIDRYSVLADGVYDFIAQFENSGTLVTWNIKAVT